MKFESKYDIGQAVFSIIRTSVERPPVACPACEDGHVVLAGERYQCPSCKGKKTVQARAYGWIVSDAGTVGSIQVEHHMARGHSYGEDYPDEEWITFVKYMFNTSGSGGVYDEPNLLPSRDEAQAECDRRNRFVRAEAA
jgi:hypothetical protein